MVPSLNRALTLGAPLNHQTVEGILIPSQFSSSAPLPTGPGGAQPRRHTSFSSFSGEEGISSTCVRSSSVQGPPGVVVVLGGAGSPVGVAVRGWVPLVAALRAARKS